MTGIATFTRRLSAVAVCGAAVAVAGPAPAGAGVYWGALAVDGAGHWGDTTMSSSPQKASASALRGCGRAACRVVVVFEGCGAVAQGPKGIKGAVHDRLAFAKDDALARAGGGKIIVADCNGY
ncbi:DUF4189 domain-containing protein [Tsukamurella pseudospumae]|uniref:DUF4189 domain-containing protein n=1 Tax=Tsukamurella pseudospumae TaxID=239498 RepID=UPI0009EE4643|nr:DUF4189 domain-containing protein [Tsukamurella pseudospumae]